jgi:uncharacterized protein (DUF1697 family)
MRAQIEEALPKNSSLDSELVKVLVLSKGQLQAVVDNRPEGFGEQPENYHSDAIFLMRIDSTQAMSVFAPREGVDKVWPGNDVVCSQRLSALRSKSRPSKITASELYKSMTIRSLNTTTQLPEMLRRIDAGREVQLNRTSPCLRLLQRERIGHDSARPAAK